MHSYNGQMRAYREFVTKAGIELLKLNLKSPESNTTETQNLPEDFRSFYNQFHTDSIFQIQHITFPLDGVEKANDGPGDILVTIKWQQNNWELHKPFNDHNGTFDRSYTIVGPIIIEEINDRNNYFSMERRFARIDGEYHLIYYGLKK